MSNLKSAEQAIQAELDHAKQGLAYYQSRVDALEDALAKVHSVEVGDGEGAEPARRGRMKMKTAPRQAKNGAMRGASSHDGGKLPPTGKDFWPELLTSEPRSPQEILRAAINALAITPSAEQTKKLSQRQANALSVLAKSGAIATAGEGRGRRYYRKQ